MRRFTQHNLFLKVIEKTVKSNPFIYKIAFNLKSKGISDENIQHGIKCLDISYVNSELASALIYAKKKKILTFDKKNKSVDEILTKT